MKPIAEEKMQTGPSSTLRPKAAPAAIAIVACWACWLLLSTGCNPRVSSDYVQNISSVSPEVATEAMSIAAENKSTRAIEPLVQRLYDEDSVIRLSAVRALKEITGQDFGYRYYEPESQRIQAIKRWEAWLAQQNAVVEEEEQVEPSE